MVLPEESEKTPDATEMTPLAVLLVVGVKVAVYRVEERAVQLESVPPETETSDRVKLEEASERVKVRAAVSPALRALSESLSVMATVGATESSPLPTIRTS